jgi:serine-type D-Ala-D-Ala carboxypeptidase/endopeptidase (penicillin-binding protein 4)
MRLIPTFVPIGLIAAIALTACQAQPNASADPTPARADPITPIASTVPPEPASPQTLTPLAPDTVDPTVQAIADRYLDRLVALGFDRTQQSLWIQTDDRLLAQWQGTQRLPAASVTKIATTLTALRVLGVDHRFTTEVGIVGTVTDGVLTGDLVVTGDRDPMLVWEDVIAIGNALNAQGIRQVTGDLVVVGDFQMNFEEDAATSAEFLAIGLDSTRWTDEARSQYATLPSGTPAPQLAIGGIVRTTPASTKPANVKPLLTYASRPLVELLDQMNRYSNNIMAHSLADAAGGVSAIEQAVIAATGINPEEIQLVNGSGLGRENQLSPRAAVMMFQAIGQDLEPQGLTVADVAAVAGVDAGILQARSLPRHAVLKSGSLDAVSTIAGGIPTAKGVIWLAVMNGGGDIEALRSAQEALITELEAYGGPTETIAPQLKPTPGRNLSPTLTLVP